MTSYVLSPIPARITTHNTMKPTLCVSKGGKSRMNHEQLNQQTEATCGQQLTTFVATPCRRLGRLIASNKSISFVFLF